jgi:hypothetical protein
VDVGRRRMSRADDDESMKTNDAAKECLYSVETKVRVEGRMRRA